MSHTPDKLLELTEGYEQVAEKALIVEAKKEKKKLDPKAKVRTKKDPVVPAERAKDKHDHFPLESANQARNALARVMQYDKVPSWYKGSLSGLQEAVRRAVKKHYPSIEVSEKKSKKSSFDVSEMLLTKYEA